MPEGVEVVGDGRAHTEFLGEVAPPFENHAHERFAAGQVDIGLQVPAPGDVPAAALDVRANALKQHRIVFFHPLVEHTLVVVEHEFGELVQQVGGGGEGRNRFPQPFLPAPQPDRIDMCVAKQVNNRTSRHGQALQGGDPQQRRAFFGQCVEGQPGLH